VFVFPAEPGIGEFARRLGRAGVEHAVLLSSLAAALEHERDRSSTSALHHAAIEKEMLSSGVATVSILRPGSFANNLRALAHPIRAGAPIDLVHPTSAQAPIHEADIADVAVALLCDSAHRGRVLPMTGPEALTRFEQLATIGCAIGREIPHREVSAEQFSSARGRFLPPGIIKLLLDYWSDSVQTPDVVRTSVQEVTGRAARPLSQWAADHARDYA